MFKSGKSESIKYGRLQHSALSIEEDKENITVFEYILKILISATPYFLFLIIFGLNKKLHILAKSEDTHLVYNLSYIEYSVLHFHPHKIISSYHLLVIDFIAAVPYLIHYVLPVAYPLYLAVIGRPGDIIKFYRLLGFFLWIQYAIWFVFPTAPPWYYDNQITYQQQGSIPPPNEQHHEGCAFRRVDEAIGRPFFFNIYGAGNPVPYGAFPSGHVAWPTAMCVTKPPFGGYCWMYVVYLTWATLYSCHHYISDALCSILIIFLVKKQLSKHEAQQSAKKISLC